MPAHDLGVAIRVIGGRVLALVIGNAEPAAEIDMIDVVPVGAQPATSSASSEKASSKGARSVICEPICISTPVTSRPGSFAAWA